MEKLIKTTLIFLLALVFLYLGFAFVLTPLPINNIILLIAIKVMGIIWFTGGIWILIKIKSIVT